MSLARTLLKLSGDAPLGFAIGIVTDITPFTIQINGDDAPIPNVPRCASYTPTIGDTVLVLRPGPGIVVVDQIV